MAKQRTKKPAWLTDEEVAADGELGHSKSTLNRFNKRGIPLLGYRKLGSTLEDRLVPRGRWGQQVRQVRVSPRDLLVAERKRQAELLAAAEADGLLAEDACRVWNISEKTLLKGFRRGVFTRKPEVYVRPDKGRGERFRYFKTNKGPAKRPTLKRAARKKTIDGKRVWSTRCVAEFLDVSQNSVLAAAESGKWHGVTFVAIPDDQGFYYDAKSVQAVKRARAKADAKGKVPGHAAEPYIEIDIDGKRVKCESVDRFAVRIGYDPHTVVASWTKACRFLAAGKVTIVRHRRKPYLPVAEAEEIERAIKAERKTGYKGFGPSPFRHAAFQMVGGEWCVLLREAARQLGMKVKSIRGWHDRGKTPGLTKPLRIHGKARTWSYMPVEQFKTIAAELDVAVEVAEPPTNGHPNATTDRQAASTEATANPPPARSVQKRRANYEQLYALWVQWKREDPALGPAAIRDRWNALTPSEQRSQAGIVRKYVGESGSVTVRRALRRANL